MWAKSTTPRSFLDNSTDGCCFKAAIQHFSLIDRAEQPFEIWSAIGQPFVKQFSSLRKRKGDAPLSKSVGFAAANEYSQRAISKFRNILIPKGNEFRPPRHQLIAEREHGAIA